VIAAGEAAFVPDVRLDPRVASLRTGRPPEATIIVPMRTPGGTIGCLRVTVLGSRRFAESDLWLAQTLADQVVLVVQIAQEQEWVRGQSPSGARALAAAAAALRDITQPVDDFLAAALLADEHAGNPGALQAQLEAARAAARRIKAGAAALRESVACAGDGVASSGQRAQPAAGSSTIAAE
jgi:GAF domain-containing protein